MAHDILFVTDNKTAYREAEAFFAEHAPQIRLSHAPLAHYELQNLDERKVIEHKAILSWNHYQQPLLVEISGFYFNRYQAYPGTLSSFSLAALGRSGIGKLCQVDNEAMAYSWTSFISHRDSPCFFRDTTDGYIMDDAMPQGQTEVELYTVFHPKGATKTLYELLESGDSAKHSPRYKTLQKFVAWYLTQDEES
ncbi:hypothetical protein HOD08_02470 [bacterium]|nr:hypothetical protein [bacterium]